MISLPEREYNTVEEDDRKIVYCTMRQKALHTVGLNSGNVGRRLYTRHGKKYYKPYRNYFFGADRDLDVLVKAGYMECCIAQTDVEREKQYWFNREGLDWLGEQIGVVIKDEEN